MSGGVNHLNNSPLPRQLLLRWQGLLRAELDIASYTVSQAFYFFSVEDFEDLLAAGYSALKPLAAPPLAELTALADNTDVHFACNEDSRQCTLQMTGNNAVELADTFLRWHAEFGKHCKKKGLRPFFAPKLDGLPPSGLHVSIALGKTPQGRLRRALRGVYELAEALVLSTCININSYKRLTPQVPTSGWDSPHLVRVGDVGNPHAVVCVEDTEAPVITLKQADAYSNLYLAMAGYLAMLHLGLLGEAVTEDEWQAMTQSGKRMPTSLNVARQLWEASPVGHMIFGRELASELVHIAKREWIAYCDTVHPWELLRGMAYEDTSD